MSQSITGKKLAVATLKAVFKDESIGKLTVVGGTTDIVGTAVLIHHDIILTAKALIEGTVTSMRFEQASGLRSDVTHHLALSDTADGLGFAICKLKHSLGNLSGYMGVGSSNIENVYTNKVWKSVGYNSAGTRSESDMTIATAVLSTVDEGWTLKITGTAGCIGAPLYDAESGYVVAVVTKYVAAVTAGGTTTPAYTQAAGGEQLGRLAKYGRSHKVW
jgi:hypothetical protein